MSRKWNTILALDSAILAATMHVVSHNEFPYNVLYGACGVVGTVVATHWALDHFRDGEDFA